MCLLGDVALTNGEIIMSNIKAVIVAGIASVAKSETNVRSKLSSLSRELLMYVPDSGDIGMVNRLLDVVTPRNREMLVLFFNEFLPWKLEKTAGIFTGKIKGKGSIEKKLTAIDQFLKREHNDVWTWADENITTTVRPKNYASKLTKLVERSLADENEGLNVQQVMTALLNADGLNIHDVISYISAIQVEIEAIEESDKEVENA